MSESALPPGYPPLNLRATFLIGYLVWFVPGIARAYLADMPWQRTLYIATWVAALNVASVCILALAYRQLACRGWSLRATALGSLLAALPVVTVGYVLDFYIGEAFPQLSTLLPGEPHTLRYAVATSLCDSVAISMMSAAIAFLPALARAHEERTRDLDLLSRESELLRVRANLEPHFVLNSLNAVAGLVEEDPAQARELLAALGDLFREATAFRAVHRVGDEIEWLRRYVTIHELRHPDKLRASWDLAEDSLDCPCPALLLQPLVENAVKHGALRGGGLLRVSSRIEGRQLLLTVEDDGPELGGPREGGRGLAIIRRRLELETLPADSLQLVREGNRTVARVRLPLRLESAHA